MTSSSGSGLRGRVSHGGRRRVRRRLVGRRSTTQALIAVRVYLLPCPCVTGLRHLPLACWCCLALALVAGKAHGQTCVLLHGGCGSPVQPQQCFPDAAGPSAWTDPGGAHTRQIRYAVQSSQSTCHGPVGIGAPPACCTSLHPPGAPGPT